MCIPLHGTLSFDGQDLHIQDPAPQGSPAILSADHALHLSIDQQYPEAPLPVTSQSQIQFSLPLPTPPKYTFDFDISTYSVQLTVQEQTPGVAFFIPSQSENRTLHLSLHQKEVPLTHFESQLWEDVQKQLRYQRIHQPLSREAFKSALEAPGTPVVVLETPQPVQPFNRLHFLYALPLPEPDTEAFALSFPTLKTLSAGKVIVEREYSHKSRAGMNVYGEVVAPENVIVPELKASNRTVRLDPERNHALSVIEGVPVFDAEAGVKMSGLQKQHSEIVGGPGHIVDLKSSLQLHNSIRDQASVWIQDYLEVQADIGHSLVEVQEGLIVHGSIIRSQLRVGGDAAARMQLREPVLKLLKDLHNILRMVKDVRSQAPHARSTDDKTLILRVIKTQFSRFEKELDALWQLNKSLKQLHPRRNMALKVVLSHLLNRAERPLNQKLLTDWIQNLEDFARELVALPDQANHAFFSYAQGTELTARGSIVVTGEGCYNSTLKSGKHIIFTGSPGYCREGTLEAEGHVIIPELGSPNGSRLKLMLSARSQIFANVVYPGVEISFGDRPAYHVLNKHQQVQIKSEGKEILFFPLETPLHTHYPADHQRNAQASTDKKANNFEKTRQIC